MSHLVIVLRKNDSPAINHYNGYNESALKQRLLELYVELGGAAVVEQIDVYTVTQHDQIALGYWDHLAPAAVADGVARIRALTTELNSTKLSLGLLEPQQAHAPGLRR